MIQRMRIGSHEYANEADDDDDDDDDVPKPAQSLGTPVPRQKPSQPIATYVQSNLNASNWQMLLGDLSHIYQKYLLQNSPLFYFIQLISLIWK